MRHQSADAYLISFPKCGRTWLRLILGRVLQQYYAVDASHEQILNLTSLAKLHADIPHIEVTHCGSPHLQYPDDLRIDPQRFDTKKVLLLVRDPRDVVVSLFHQRQKRDHNYHGSLSDFIREPRGSLATIIRFYNLWAELAATKPGEVHIVSYEDLKTAGPLTIASALTHVGFPSCPSHIIDEAIDFASFDNMRHMERGQRISSARLRPADPADPNAWKTRRGKVGGYLDELGREEIEFVDATISAQLSPLFNYHAPGRHLQT